MKLRIAVVGSQGCGKTSLIEAWTGAWDGGEGAAVVWPESTRVCTMSSVQIEEDILELWEQGHEQEWEDLTYGLTAAVLVFSLEERNGMLPSYDAAQALLERVRGPAQWLPVLLVATGARGGAQVFEWAEQQALPLYFVDVMTPGAAQESLLAVAKAAKEYAMGVPDESNHVHLLRALSIREQF